MVNSQKEEERKRKADQKQREKEEKEKRDEERRAEKEKDKAETDKRKEVERIEREKRKEEERIETEKRKEVERIEREKRKEEERKRKEEEARILAERLAAEKAAFRKEFGAQMDDNISTVKVTFFEKRADKKYWFTVEVYRSSGNKVVYRTYQVRVHCHISVKRGDI